MTDDRPRPKYGEYAPAPPRPVLSELPPPVVEPAAAPPHQRRTWDVVFTVALLFIGLWDVIISYPQFADLGSALGSAYAQQGIGEFTSDELATAMGTAINIVRIVLIGTAVGLGVWQLRRGRLAFWIPLSAGVLALLVVLVCVIVVVTTDPALAAYVAEQAAAN